MRDYLTPEQRLAKYAKECRTTEVIIIVIWFAFWLAVFFWGI